MSYWMSIRSQFCSLSLYFLWHWHMFQWNNTPFGAEVGALPSGRRAGKPLADGVSPNSGTDTNGPSAVLKSVSYIPHDRFVQGTLLNMKLAPEMVATENGIHQLMALLKSLCTLGVYHVQFNVVDLPAAFGEFSRQMVPRLLVNGCEVIMQINMDELIRAMDKIVYLRRKKLRQQSRLQSGMKS